MAAAAVCLPSFNSTRTDSSDVETFQYENHGREALKRALTCFENEQFCDVVLVAGSDGKRIPAHRLILLASKYFHAMFIGSLRESSDKEVTIKEVDSDALHSLVRYLYTGSLELREETVETLLITASFLQIDSAVTACCEFLGRQLHPSNCIGFAFFASQRNLSTLLGESQEFICEHFVEVSKNIEFLQLEVDQLVDILSKDELLAPSEEFIFTAALKWIEHDPDNRQKYFAEILAFIRLPLLQTTYIVDNVLPICGTIETKDLVIETLKWHLLPQRRLSINQHLGVKSTPRKSYQLMLAIIQKSYKPSEIQVYDKIWSTLNTSLPLLECHAFAVVGNEIIFAGGVQKPQYRQFSSGATFKLNLNNMKRTDMTSMQVPRSRHGLASYNGYLYAVGGLNIGDALCSLEIWSPLTQVWSSDKNMPTARYATGTAILNGCLYVVGGCSNQNLIRNTVECYDVLKMEWNTKTPMRFARQGLGVAVVDGFLYVVGGGSDGTEKIVERYDPATDAWTLIPAPSVISGRVRCTALGKKIYVAFWTGKVQEYDTVTNKWEEFPAVSGECYRVTLLTTSYAPPPKDELKRGNVVFN